MLTGTGTVFKIGFMRELRQARRDGRLPDLGETRNVYDISALTEDKRIDPLRRGVGLPRRLTQGLHSENGDDADLGQSLQAAAALAAWGTGEPHRAWS